MRNLIVIATKRLHTFLDRAVIKYSIAGVILLSFFLARTMVSKMRGSMEMTDK